MQACVGEFESCPQERRCIASAIRESLVISPRYDGHGPEGLMWGPPGALRWKKIYLDQTFVRKDPTSRLGLQREADSRTAQDHSQTARIKGSRMCAGYRCADALFIALATKTHATEHNSNAEMSNQRANCNRMSVKTWRKKCIFNVLREILQRFQIAFC